MKRTTGILSRNLKRVMAAVLSAAMVLSGIHLDGNRREVQAAELMGTIDFVPFVDADFLADSGTDFMDGLDYTVISPSEKISFGLPEYPDDEDGYSYAWYLPGEEPSVDPDESWNLVDTYSPISVIDGDADKAVLYRLKSGAPEAVDDPETSEVNESEPEAPAVAQRLSSIVYELQELTELELTVYESTQRIRITDQDPFYDPSASQTLYYANVQMAYAKDAESVETDPADVLNWTDKDAVETALSKRDERYDGTYTVYKKAELKDAGNTLIYFGHSQVERDFNINITDVTISSATRTGTLDLASHKLTLTKVKPAEDIEVSFTSPDTTITRITVGGGVIVDDQYDPRLDFYASGDTVIIPGNVAYAGRDASYVLTLAADGKYLETYNVKISYLTIGDWEPVCYVSGKDMLKGKYYIGQDDIPVEICVDVQTDSETEKISSMVLHNITTGTDVETASIVPAYEAHTSFTVTPEMGGEDYKAIIQTDQETTHESDPITVFYDPYAPVITPVSAVQEGRNYKIGEDGTIEGKLNPDAPLVITILAEDDGTYDSGLAQNPFDLKISDGTNLNPYSLKSGDAWEIHVRAYSSHAGKDEIVTVTVSDLAGNKTTREFLLSFAKQTFSVEHVIEPALNDDNATKEASLNINYSITSDVELSGLELRYQKEGEEEYTVDASDLSLTAAPETDGEYMYEYTFPLTSTASVSYHEIGACAVNVFGTRSKEDVIETVNVDLTPPEWQDMDPVDDNAWYRSVLLTVQYGDPMEGGYASGVDRSSIQNLSGAEIVSVTENEDGTYTAVLIVDPSMDSSGTEVSFVVQDKVGNPSSAFMKTYYVDNREPSVTTLSVNKRTANYVCFSGDPFIAYNTQDNIAIDNVGLEVYFDGSLVKSYDDCPSSMTNHTLSSLLSHTLSSLLGVTSEELIDGEYKVRVTVSDLVADQEPVSREIIFKLYNTTPYIGEDLFPDEAFRNYVLQNIDKDKDKFLSDEEREAVVDIFVENMGIEDLTGIEFFTNLVYLECCDNGIRELDMGFAPELMHLICENNQLKKLDVSQNRNLEVLRCAGNRLTELDVTNCVKLRGLEIQNNLLTELDVTNCVNLQYLDIQNNLLTELDVTNNQELLQLHCPGNNLSSLDVSMNTDLVRLGCRDNFITELDVSSCPKLSFLDCRDNELTALELSRNPLLNNLICYNNQIKLLDLRNNEEVTGLNESSAMILIYSDEDLGWRTVDSDTYYAYDLGVTPKQSRLATGLKEIDGKKYYFTPEGVLLEDVVPTSIEVTPGAVSMTTWDTAELEVDTTPSGAKSYLLWESDDESIVTVDDSGVLTAVKPGSTSVTVSALYDPSMMVTIPVTVKPVLSLEADELDLLTGEPVSVGYTANTEKIKSITCVTADPDVATATADLVILGEGEGETDITVKVSDGEELSEEYTIHVIVSGAESVNTDVSRIELYYNRELITEEDEIQALVEDDLEFTARIYLEGVDEPYEYSYDNSVIQTGNGRIRLNWKTTNIDVATVAKGSVHVSGAGTTFITAQAMGTEIVSDAITISAKAPAIQLRGITIGDVTPVEVGQNLYLKAAFTPVNAENKEVYWESDDPDIAKVNEYGMVTGVSLGTTTIHVISVENEMITDSVEVEVIPNAVKTLTVQEGSVTSTGGGLSFVSRKEIAEGETLILKHGIDHQICIRTTVNDDAVNKEIGITVYDEEGEPLAAQDISEECTGLSDVNQVFRIDLEDVGTYDVKLVAMDGYGAKKTFTVKMTYYDEWVQEEDGSTRHYTKDRMDTGWSTIDSQRYYFGDDGVLATGWQQIGESRYFFGDDGIMVTGWQKLDGKWYLFGTDGVMVTGWKKNGGKWYYFNLTEGFMMTGWQKIGGKWYYFNPTEGFMMTGWQKISSKWYYFNPTEGFMMTGWQKIDGKWYYFDPKDGYMVNNWQKIGSRWYYFQNGALVTGWKQISGKWYYFDPTEGYMMTGWQKIGSKWYYFDPTEGYMITGWKKSGGKWYYFDPKDGYMVTGTVKINGKTYQFSSEGVCLNP